MEYASYFVNWGLERARNKQMLDRKPAWSGRHTHRAFPSTQKSTKLFTPRKVPTVSYKPHLWKWWLRTSISPCFAGSAVTHHPQHYKCTSDTKEVKKGANFKPSRMFSGCQTQDVCLCEGEIEGRDRRALEKKLKASTSASLIQSNPAAGI